MVRSFVVASQAVDMALYGNLTKIEIQNGAIVPEHQVRMTLKSHTEHSDLLV